MGNGQVGTPELYSERVSRAVGRGEDHVLRDELRGGVVSVVVDAVVVIVARSGGDGRGGGEGMKT